MIQYFGLICNIIGRDMVAEYSLKRCFVIFKTPRFASTLFKSQKLQTNVNIKKFLLFLFLYLTVLASKL